MSSHVMCLLLMLFAAIVNMLKPGTASTFSDYTSQVFLPYITAQLQSVQKVDVVWDEYLHGSLKAYTRSMSGKKEAESSNNMPRNWKEFLRNDELFSFLSLEKANIETKKQVLSHTTRTYSVLSQGTPLVLLLAPRKRRLIQGFSCIIQMMAIVK